MPTGTALTVDGTGTFDLGGFAQTVTGLADGGVGTGTVTDSGAAATSRSTARRRAASPARSPTVSHALALTKTRAAD